MSLLSSIVSFAAPETILREKPKRTDANDITRAVSRHCRIIGCDDSNTIASIAWALKAPGSTIDAVRAGNKRADQLRWRQRPALPTPA